MSSNHASPTRTLNSTELAELFCLSPLSIHSTLVRRPDRLPPPIRVPGSSRLLWLESDVLTWLESHKVKVASTPRKRGRPHKQPKSIAQKQSQATLDTLAQRDVMRAAIHECSHAAVARHFSSEARPHIFKVDVCSDEYRNWRGTCKVNFTETVTPAQRRMIGIAGLAGEFLFIDHEDEVSVLISVGGELMINDDVLSDTDHALAKGIDDDEILTTIRLLTVMRNDIKREAQELADEAQQ